MRLIWAFLATALACAAQTTVSWTVNISTGVHATGYIVVTPNRAFTSPGGVVVGNTPTTVNLNASTGVFSVALYPNTTATPQPSFYTAEFHLVGAPAYSMQWTIPATPNPCDFSCAAGPNPVIIQLSQIDHSTASAQYCITYNGVAVIWSSCAGLGSLTGVIYSTAGVPSVVAGNPTNCVLVSGASAACGASSVTSITAGCGLSGGTITTVGTIAYQVTVNSQTGTTYTFLNTDCAKLVTFSNGSSIAATLPQATGPFGTNFSMWVSNRGAGTLTITPTTSTIDGAATLALTTNQGVLITSDGTNYFTGARGTGTGGSGGTSQVCLVTRTSATVLTLASAASSTNPCVLNGTSFVSPITVTVGANGGTAYIYAQGSSIIAGYGGGTFAGGNVTCSGCTATFGITAFPNSTDGGTVPIWTWTATAATWDTSGGTKKLGEANAVSFTAGTNVTLTPGADSLAIAVPTATTSNLGAVQPDGTSITISAGVISSTGGTSVLKSVRIPMTAADISTTGSSALLLSAIAAPGAGFYLQIVHASLCLVPASTAFTGGGNFSFKYGSGSGNSLAISGLQAAIITGHTASCQTSVESGGWGPSLISAVDNAQIYLQAGGAWTGGGNDTAVLYLDYIIVQDN